jgi:hypothetical protein
MRLQTALQGRKSVGIRAVEHSRAHGRTDRETGRLMYATEFANFASECDSLADDFDELGNIEAAQRLRDLALRFGLRAEEERRMEEENNVLRFERAQRFEVPDFELRKAA